MAFLHPGLLAALPALQRLALHGNPVLASGGVLAAAVLKGVGAPGLRSTVACMTVEERAAEITGMLQLAADAEQL